jgi:hypothetical protein
MTFDDLEFNSRNAGLPGVQAMAFFGNGYGASVIKGYGSYGVDDELYELAVIKANGDDPLGWDICYDTEITSDVLGHLTKEEVTSLLHEIEAL